MRARDPLQELRDPLQELKDALSFQTSPDFCARVRQQVAAEPVRSRMFGAWSLAAAAAVILAAGIGAISTLRHLEVGAVWSAGALAPPESSGPEAPDLHLARVPQRPTRVTAQAAVSAYETVVPDDQLHALDRLLSAMQAGRASVPPVVAEGELNDRGERVLRALVIEPVMVELLAGTPAEPIKNPVKDPNK